MSRKKSWVSEEARKLEDEAHQKLMPGGSDEVELSLTEEQEKRRREVLAEQNRLMPGAQKRADRRR